ncbi:uncharacterized protein [Panulirus ornatus]|uniref:uncharacterized protein n=1 Tax=Panulirus ornatus TaxID=150431 RepID=UPI003A869D63
MADLLTLHQLLLVLLVTVGDTWCASVDYPDYVDPNPSYAVAWEVKNDSTFDDKSRQEVLQDGTVEGRYTYVRPDGVRQVVTYRANDEIGFTVHVALQDATSPFGEAGRPTPGQARGLGSSSTSSTGETSLRPSSTPSGRSSSPSSTRGIAKGRSLIASSGVNRVLATQKVWTPATLGPPVVSKAGPSSGTQRVSSPSPSPRPAPPSPVQPETEAPARAQRGSVSLPTAIMTDSDAAILKRPSVVNIPTTRPPPHTPISTTRLPPPTTSGILTLPPTPAARRPRPVASVGGGQQPLVGGDRGTSGSGLSKGVAHVSFSSPTHQYSYPLVVN